MSNLPAKQSAFSKMRNNILKAGLSNRLTRSIMANTMPSLFGYGLTGFVLNSDEKDLSQTMIEIAIQKYEQTQDKEEFNYLKAEANYIQTPPIF